MKKFLSLVMALVMTMSLVTIGAGATEYQDLTDKNEIQYEEAVAVLNKLGIISGYEDGSFRPTGALTRGAAAKIIVSLMIGPEAANALTVSAAPYSDVPVTNTFAAVISYCKTAGYINGYTDGTFRPAAALTGYAFTKMLLGALGYDGKIEGFTGSGWTMNVAKLGNKAGLFNDFNTAFQGNDGVNRESACLLALNTIKGTLVEYNGTTVNVTTGDAQVSVGNTAYTNVISNNTKINTNIKTTYDANGMIATNAQTLEFGEQHFQDLVLTHEGSDADDFGRPANQWAYKKVKIGTYALTPDYVYTTGASGDTAADKVKDMGLRGFKFRGAASNGTIASFNVAVNGNDIQFGTGASGDANAIDSNAELLEFIADKITGKGVQVEVYLEEGTADTIRSVVVIYSQMMQVNSVKSDTVTLKQLEDPANTVWVDSNSNSTVDGSEVVLYTVPSVKAVEDDDDAYETLKDLKADDYVVVTPVRDGSNYAAYSVVVPQAITGTLSNIKVNASNNKVTAITVADTQYDMGKLWSSEDNELTATTKLTSKEATAYLDSFGYALYVTNVQASNDTIVIDEIYSSLENGRLVKYAQGWDANGNELSLNLGTSSYLPAGYTNEAMLQGTTWEYTTSTSNSADYRLVTEDGTGLVRTVSNAYVSAGQASMTTDDSDTYYFDGNVKFIFLSHDSDNINDVDGIVVHEGVAEVGSATVLNNLKVILNKDKNKIVAVVVPNDDDAANTANVLFFQKVTNHINNADGKKVAVFTAYINGEQVTNCQLDKDIPDGTYNGKFFTYSKNESTGVYTLSGYTKTDKATSVMSNVILGVSGNITNKTYINSLNGVSDLNAKNAVVIDLYTDDGKDYSSLKEIAESGLLSFKVSLVYNGDNDTNGYKTVSYIFITGNGAGASAFDFTYTGSNPKVYQTLSDATTDTDEVSTNTSFAAGTTLYVVAPTALRSLSTTSVNGLELVGFDGSNKAIYKITPNADFNSTDITEAGSADFFTVTGTNFTYDDGTAVANGAVVAKDTVLNVTTSAALKAIGTALTGAAANPVTLKTAPAAATDKAVYSFKVGANVSYNSVNEAAGWVDLAVVDTIGGDSREGTFDITVTPSKTGIVKVGETITYTVAISGGAVGADAADKITVTFANLDRTVYNAPVLAEVNCATVGTIATAPVTTVTAVTAAPGEATATEYTVVGVLKGGAAPTIAWANAV